VEQKRDHGTSVDLIHMGPWYNSCNIKEDGPRPSQNENIYILSDQEKRWDKTSAFKSAEALAGLKNDYVYLKFRYTSELLQTYINLKRRNSKKEREKRKSWQMRHY
jgi:glutamine synthetase